MRGGRAYANPDKWKILFSHGLFEVTLNSVCNQMHLQNWDCQSIYAYLLLYNYSWAFNELPWGCLNHALHLQSTVEFIRQLIHKAHLLIHSGGQMKIERQKWPTCGPTANLPRAGMTVQESGITLRSPDSSQDCGKPVPWCPKRVIEQHKQFVSQLQRRDYFKKENNASCAANQSPLSFKHLFERQCWPFFTSLKICSCVPLAWLFLGGGAGSLCQLLHQL